MDAIKTISTRELMTELMERMEMLDPIALPLTKAAKLCGVGVEVLKEWADNDPSFPVIGLKKRRVVPLEDLREYISQKARLRVGAPARSSVVADIVERQRKEGAHPAKGKRPRKAKPEKTVVQAPISAEVQSPSADHPSAMEILLRNREEAKV